jgi:hypothetical protein
MEVESWPFTESISALIVERRNEKCSPLERMNEWKRI